MQKKQIKILTGQVVEALPNTNFKVRVDETAEEVLAHLSGKMRMHRIKVLVGDKVRMEISEYGGNRGRIVQRF
jgi:translation initiation factor IF-1